MSKRPMPLNKGIQFSGLPINQALPVLGFGARVECMDSDMLPIRLFFLASALLLAVEAAKAKAALKYGFGSGSAAFILAALYWKPIAALVPKAASAVNDIAHNPPSWFLLAIIIYWATRQLWDRTARKTARKGSAVDSISSSPFPIPTSVPQSVDIEPLREEVRNVQDIATQTKEVLAALVKERGLLQDRSDLTFLKEKDVAYTERHLAKLQEPRDMRYDSMNTARPINHTVSALKGIATRLNVQVTFETDQLFSKSFGAPLSKEPKFDTEDLQAEYRKATYQAAQRKVVIAELEKRIAFDLPSAQKIIEKFRRRV